MDTFLTTDRISKTYITIFKNTIDKNYNKDFVEFTKNNNNIEQFKNNPYHSTVMTHFRLNLSNEDYLLILKEIQRDYYSDVSMDQIELVEEETIKKSWLTRKNIENFVDTLILAFISGSVLGIILLNIYSKIIQYI